VRGDHGDEPPAGSIGGDGAPAPTTFRRTVRLSARSSIAAVTSRRGGGVFLRGTITLTRVVISWSPKRKRFVGIDCGRSASICSRVPKKSAWLGHTVAHIGRFPIDVRS
jgi:hypothetical protein